jgi:benzoyl-CoA reductase/2-hydroxyglutaryl-CoA dehydratase subunit BcrC/BadD/HgdB
MIELLKLCGFKPKEIESELPRVEKAFNRLGITAEDIQRGKQRLHKYYDIELEGVRKAFRLIVLEIVDIMLAREEGKTKILYGYMIPGFEKISSLLVSHSKEVYAAYQNWAFLLIVGCVFDKMGPLLEAAEKKWLKAGLVAHCANVKAIVGLLALDLVPSPDLMLSSGFLCETAPKTLDVLHELYDMPIYCWDTCRDREVKEYADATKRAVNLQAKSLRRLVERIQEIVGFEITDDMLGELLDARSKLDDALDKLRELIQSSDPLPISPTHDALWMCLDWLALRVEDRLPDAIDAINTVYEELRERVNKGLGVVEKGAPRILAMLPPQHSDPRLEHLVTELGMAIVALDAYFSVPSGGVTKDPYVTMSSDVIRNSLYTSLTRRISLLIEVCKRLNVDGVLNRFHVGCRTVAGDALIIKNALEKELGIPVLLLEYESFDPRVYNHEQLKRRLEVFKTMLIKKSG